jgi:cytochrome P450
MTVGASSKVHYDPYDVELNSDPFPMFRRLREQAPLYYNAEHDFYALSRFADVNKGLVNHETFRVVFDCSPPRHINDAHDTPRPACVAYVSRRRPIAKLNKTPAGEGRGVSCSDAN